MSNLASAEHLRRATSQLPVSWYCDPAVYEAEQRLLFARAPGYVGHELMFTTLISTTDLAAHLDDPSFVIVDVRHDLSQPETWGESQYQAAHIPGARFAHMTNINIATTICWTFVFYFLLRGLRSRKPGDFMPVQGAGGVSAAMSELEGRYAFAWARNIWADALA